MTDLCQPAAERGGRHQPGEVAKEAQIARVIVLLCHKVCVAAGTSWELSHESADEFSPDGGDRPGGVAFGTDGRRSTGGALCRL
jgi:hypothetical protein